MAYLFQTYLYNPFILYMYLLKNRWNLRKEKKSSVSSITSTQIGMFFFDSLFHSLINNKFSQYQNITLTISKILTNNTLQLHLFDYMQNISHAFLIFD